MGWASEDLCSMIETPRTRITVTSSSNEMYTNQLVRVVVRGGGGLTPHAPTTFLQQASGQIFKDDVNGFSSTSDIYFMRTPLR